MRGGERGEGRGPRDPKDPKDSDQVTVDIGAGNLEQIEYLLFQSTQGVHFIFENTDIAKILSRPQDDKKFFTEANMNKVQRLLSDLLDCPGVQEKRSFLESLVSDDFELLVRAYFQLVENTILAHSTLRH